MLTTGRKIKLLKHRKHFLRVLSMFVSGLFFAQLLVTTLHFLALEHCTVTRDGAPAHGAHGAHGHRLPEQAGAEHRRALLPEAVQNDSPECGFLNILLRTAHGVKGPLRLAAGPLDEKSGSGVVPPRKESFPATPLLTNAPKHSPPSSC